jgi:acyl-CoA thioesterase-1
MLNDDEKYNITNYGCSGRTMMKTGDMPYWNEPQYQQVHDDKPDVIIIQLGTNDSKDYQWNEEEYTKDYLEMAKSFQGIESSPELYIMIPPPLY